jgi:hypothetical protein
MEVVDDQLNATVLHMIHLVVSPKDRAHIRLHKTSKDAWDKLDALFIINESIQDSKFEEFNTISNSFIMNEGETAEDMYRQFVALTEQTHDLGASHANDKWIKKKFTMLSYPMRIKVLTLSAKNQSTGICPPMKF